MEEIKPPLFALIEPSETAMKAVEYTHTNPIKESVDNTIKRLGAVLITELEFIREAGIGEQKRRASVAITAIEDGVMWGVKALY